MTPADISWLTGIATTVTIILGSWFMLVKFIQPLFSRLRNLMTTTEQFVRDWHGEPATAGRDAVPGVMERLNNIDGELKRNGGKSVKDTVNRIEQRLVDGDKKFDDLYTRIIKLEDKLGIVDPATPKTTKTRAPKKVA